RVRSIRTLNGVIVNIGGGTAAAGFQRDWDCAARIVDDVIVNVERAVPAAENERRVGGVVHDVVEDLAGARAGTNFLDRVDVNTREAGVLVRKCASADFGVGGTGSIKNAVGHI